MGGITKKLVAVVSILRSTQYFNSILNCVKSMEKKKCKVAKIETKLKMLFKPDYSMD